MLAFLLAPAQMGGKTLSADQVLSPYIYVFYIAFVVAFLFTPIMRIVANYYGIIDQPDGVRKMHAVPVAYLGGAAVFLGWIAGLAISQFLQFHRGGLGEAGLPAHLVIDYHIIIGASIIIALGVWDDVRGIKPWVKIGGQVIAAISLLFGGLGTHMTRLFLDPVCQRLAFWFNMPTLPEQFIVATSSILVITIVVICCNATNLMDGLDGLCGGVTAVVSAGFLFLAVHLAMFELGVDPNTDAVRVVLALSLLGAVLGFVPVNFNPASIFMGDTGSMFLGFCCATMIVLAGHGQHPKWVLSAMVMFALPILDTALAFARRWVNRRPLFSADRYHFHHQMVARGYTVKQTVVLSYGLALGFGILGATIAFMRTRYAVAFYLVIFGSIIVTAYKMGMVHEKARVLDRRRLASQDAAVTTRPIELNTVVEIRDNPRGVIQNVGSADGANKLDSAPAAEGGYEPHRG